MRPPYVMRIKYQLKHAMVAPVATRKKQLRDTPWSRLTPLYRVSHSSLPAWRWSSNSHRPYPSRALFRLIFKFSSQFWIALVIWGAAYECELDIVASVRG